MFYTICLPSPPIHGPLHTYLSLDKASVDCPDPVTDGSGLSLPNIIKTKPGRTLHTITSISKQQSTNRRGCISATHLLVTGPLTWSQMDKSGAQRREVIYYNTQIFPIWTRNNFLCRCYWGGCSCNCDDSIRILWCKDINHCRGARK